MDTLLWRERISNRTDLVARITHLTRGKTDDAAFEKLWKIITEKKLIGSGKTGYIVGNERAVCFQEVPLYAIAENLLYEDSMDGGNTRYSWFGLRFNKRRMYAKGARPVIYGKTEELKKMLPEDEYWRIVRLDLDSENCIDWSHEREWRIQKDFCFSYDDIEVIVKDNDYYRIFVERCLKENREDILLGINGVIPLNTVIS